LGPMESVGMDGARSSVTDTEEVITTTLSLSADSTLPYSAETKQVLDYL